MLICFHFRLWTVNIFYLRLYSNNYKWWINKTFKKKLTTQPGHNPNPIRKQRVGLGREKFRVGLGYQSNQPELLGWVKKIAQPNLARTMYTPTHGNIHMSIGPKGGMKLISGWYEANIMSQIRGISNPTSTWFWLKIIKCRGAFIWCPIDTKFGELSYFIWMNLNPKSHKLWLLRLRFEAYPTFQ